MLDELLFTFGWTLLGPEYGLRSNPAVDGLLSSLDPEPTLFKFVGLINDSLLH